MKTSTPKEIPIDSQKAIPLRLCAAFVYPFEKPSIPATLSWKEIALWRSGRFGFEPILQSHLYVFQKEAPMDRMLTLLQVQGVTGMLDPNSLTNLTSFIRP